MEHKMIFIFDKKKKKTTIQFVHLNVKLIRCLCISNWCDKLVFINVSKLFELPLKSGLHFITIVTWCIETFHEEQRLAKTFYRIKIFSTFVSNFVCLNNWCLVPVKFKIYIETLMRKFQKCTDYFVLRPKNGIECKIKTVKSNHKIFVVGI